MFPVNIDTTPWCHSQFRQEVNDAGIKSVLNLIDEVRDVSYIRDFSTKKKMARIYNSKVMTREI